MVGPDVAQKVVAELIANEIMDIFNIWISFLSLSENDYDLIN